METTQVTTAQETSLAVPTGAWGACETTTASDLIIPRLLVMQGLSDMMQDEKLGAKLGEIRESLEGRLVGSKDKPVQFIPFFMNTGWVVREKRNGKFEYLRVEERTASNDGLEWEFQEKNDEGKLVDMTREKTINVYLLIPQEIDRGEYLPYLFTFSRTSFKAGKVFMTLVEMLKQSRLSPAHRVFELTTVKTENEKGTWYTPEVRRVGETSQKHLAAAYEWYKTVSAGKVRVDEPEVDAQTNAEDASTREY